MAEEVQADLKPALTPPDPGYDCRCQRCGHQWRTRVPDFHPKQCGKCKSAYWDVPRSRDHSGTPEKSPDSVKRRKKRKKSRKSPKNARKPAKQPSSRVFTKQEEAAGLGVGDYVPPPPKRR